MRWRMPVSMRVMLCLVALGCVAGGVAGLVINIRDGRVADVVWSLVIICVGVYPGVLGWRSSLTIDGDVLTVCNGFRDRVISRDEITDLGTSNFGVGVGYERDGRRRFVTAGAGRGC